jgi:hypothetical protein
MDGCPDVYIKLLFKAKQERSHDGQKIPLARRTGSFSLKGNIVTIHHMLPARLDQPLDNVFCVGAGGR